MRPARAGFTLVELLAALLLTGVVVLLTHQVFATVSGGTRALSQRRAALDRERNAQRWLAAAWSSLEVGGAAGGFTGAPESAAFTTWLQVPGGWFERRRVQLLVVDGAWVADTGGGRLWLADSMRAVGYDYLLTPGAESRWVGSWVSPTSAPLAVRLRVQRAGCRGACTDTLLFLIGPRG